MTAKIYRWLIRNQELCVSILWIALFFYTVQNEKAYKDYIVYALFLCIPIYYHSIIWYQLKLYYKKWKSVFIIMNGFLLLLAGIIAKHVINEKLGVEPAHMKDAYLILAFIYYIKLVICVVCLHFVLIFFKDLLMAILKHDIFSPIKCIIFPLIVVLYFITGPKKQIKRNLLKIFSKSQLDKQSFILGISSTLFMGMAFEGLKAYEDNLVKTIILADAYTNSVCSKDKRLRDDKKDDVMEYVYLEKNELECYQIQVKPKSADEYMKFKIIQRP